MFSTFFPISLNSFLKMVSHQEVLTLALTVVLQALPSLTYGVTLHVKPTSTNTSCPTHPCHTLSEYAQDPGQYFNDSNLTLQFLPGNHTSNATLIIANIHRLKLLGNSSAVVPTKVLCSSRVGFTFKHISKVKLDGLAFVYCARTYVVQVSNGDGSFTTTCMMQMCPWQSTSHFFFFFFSIKLLH